MSIYNMKRSLFTKTVSMFLILTFSLYNVSSAVPDDGIKVPEKAEVEKVLSVDDIGIAIDLGTIKSRHDGGNGKVIIHIQDAHCNYEAQSNINRMLAQLNRELGIKMISVEGAEGVVDTAWFRAFPDAEIRREVADYFMKKGEITGAEFFSITTDDFDGTIFGAETKEYYIKNLKAFTEVYPYKQIIEGYFLNLRSIANRLKSMIYPKKLKELDRSIRAFDEKDMELSAFAEYLQKTARKTRVPVDGYADFKKLIDTLEYEKKVDFDTVDQERSAYIDLLGKKLTKEQMTDLVGKSVMFKKGHIKSVNFYSYLRELANVHKIAIVREYPNLFYYYLYTKLYDTIDNEKLFKEINIVKKELKKKLFTNDVQRKLDKYSEMVDLYVDLVNIELTNEDYDTFNEYRAEFGIEDVSDFIGSLCGQYNLNYTFDSIPVQVSENLPNMVDFYEIAIKRDKALIDNTLNRMKETNNSACILIAGGFHTKGIKELLEAEGVSYIVVTPKITKDVETPYIKVLTNQRTSLEDIITESAAISGIKSVSKSELASYLRVQLVNFYLEDDPDLAKMSAEIKEVEGGASFELVAEDAHKAMVQAAVETWLDTMQRKADPAVWEQAAKKWDSLMSAYIELYKRAKEDGQIDSETQLVITQVFKERFSPGEQAVRADSYESLTTEQAAALDEVIASLMEAGSYKTKEIKVKAKYEKTRRTRGNTLQLVALKGFKEAIESYNLTHEVQIPSDIVVHPGTGKGQWARMYIDSRDFKALNKSQKSRLANHEFYHILNPEKSEQDAIAAFNDPLTDIRELFAKVEKTRLKEKKKMLEEQLAGVIANINAAIKYRDTNDSVKIAAVVSGSEVDQKNWQQRLDETSSHIFNSDGSTLVLSLQEKIGKKTREGNFLGTLLAYSYIKEEAERADINYRDYVTMIGMLFGRGERMSPYTQIEGDRKPAIASTAASMEIGGVKKPISAIEEALLYFTPVAKYLEKRGFKGVLDKWGDETEIASVDLSKDPAKGETLADNDVVKVISILKITDELAEQKDWVVFDEDGRMLAQLSRNKKDVLIGKLKALGIKPRKDGEYYAGISLGPVAVSYDVLDIASNVFAEDIRKPGVYFDFDPYLLMALAMENDTDKWAAAIAEDGSLQKLEEIVPDFFEKVQNIKKIFKERYSRELNLTVLDLGAEVFWADIGQHSAMRDKYLAVNDRGAKGIIARSLEGISDERDENGNIIINSPNISPDVTITNSVIINSTITGKGRITGSVVKDSTLADVEMTGAFAVLSHRTGKTVLKNKSGIYKSLGSTLSDLTLEEAQRHGTLLTSKGPIDLMVEEKTNLRDKDNTYNVPILGNAISFDDAYNEMFGVSMEDLEGRHDEVLEQIKLIDEKAEKFGALKFGTSGLRDTVEKMTDMECYINTRGFIEYLIETGDIKRGDKVSVAGDRRFSTPRIMAAVLQAVRDSGCEAENCGQLPSPAISYWGLINGNASIMVTGSHIPDDRNGIKFNKKAGEVLKADEDGILDNVRKVRIEVYAKPWTELPFDKEGMFTAQPKPGSENATPVLAYLERYKDAFPANFLEGKKVVLYQHSAVGRDMVEKIFQALGAEVIAPKDEIEVTYADDKTGEQVTEKVALRSEAFVPVDTEKVGNKTQAILKKLAQDYQPDVIISTDGDSDRPLFVDEAGNFLPGDKLGALAAKFLKPDFIAIPVSANPGVVEENLKGAGIEVLKTKIGSPYVIKAMNDYLAEHPDAKVVSWEVNGGFLISTPFDIPGGEKALSPLATRDAVLPLLLAIGQIAKGQKASEFVAENLTSYETTAGVVDKKTPGCEAYTYIDFGKEIIKDISPSDKQIGEVRFDGEKITAIDIEGKPYDLSDKSITELKNLKSRYETYFTPERGFTEDIVSVNYLDGVQIVFANNEISHLRPSGNAPEFRNYAGATTKERAEEIANKRYEIIPAIIADMAAQEEGVQTPGTEAVRTDKAAEKTPEENKSLEGAVSAIEEGRPVYIKPYMSERVWGNRYEGRRIGEFWYGTGQNDADAESSLVVTGVQDVKLTDVINAKPTEAIGEKAVRNYGKNPPLTKLLTPAQWLSVQFHETKNEVWLVTSIDEKLLDDKPAQLILGYSEQAVKEYGDGVSMEYQRMAKLYDTALSALTSVIMNAGYIELLKEYQEVMAVVEDVKNNPGSERIVAMAKRVEEIRQKLNEFYNFVQVKAGDVIAVPAGTLHALGPGINVIEPQIAGTTQSTDDYDRLRYKKPWWPEAKQGLDIGRAHESRPEVGQKAELIEVVKFPDYKIERMPGGFESKGLQAVVMTFNKETTLDVSGIDSFHEMWLVEGSAKIVTDNGLEFDVPQALPGKEMLLIPASAKNYKIVAEAGTKLVDISTPVLEEHEVLLNSTRDEAVTAVTGLALSEELIVFTENGDTFDRLKVIGERKTSEIIGEDRAYSLIVQDGEVTLKRADGTEAELKAGDRINLKGEATIINKTPEKGAAVVKVMYEKTADETAVYGAFNMLKDHMDKLQGVKAELIMPSNMFVPGDAGKVGTAKWEEEQLKAYLQNSDISIRTYDANLGIEDAAKKGVSDDKVTILVAPQAIIEAVTGSSDDKVAKFLKGNVRVIAIPDIHKDADIEGKGWFFTREVESTALLLAGIGAEEIAAAEKGKDNAAAALQKFIEQITGKQVKSGYLYSLLSYNELQNSRDVLPDELKAAMDGSPFGWLMFVVKNLLLKMPIKAYRPGDELDNRRKLLWSV